MKRRKDISTSPKPVTNKLDHLIDYVVRIHGGLKDGEPIFLGTGMVIAPNWVLTCNHVAMEANPHTGEPSELPHECFFIQIDVTGKLIPARLHAHDRSSDLALLELGDSIAVNYPTFLWRISGDFTPNICEQHYSVEGFQKKNHGQTLEEWRNLTVLIPQRNKRENYLSELLLAGSTEVGSSGSPLILKLGSHTLCIGMMYLGGGKSDSSKAASGDIIVRFLNSNHIKGVRKIAAEDIFIASHTQPAVTPNSSALTRYLLISIIGFIFLGFGIWGIWSQKGIVSHTNLTAHSQPVPQCDSEFQQIGNTTDHQGFRILVLSFAGSDIDAMIEGKKIAQQLQLDIETYKRSQEEQPIWKTAHLTAEGLNTQFLPCTVASHEDARKVGIAQQFDLVIWGQVTTQIVGSHREFSIYPFATATSFNALNRTPEKPKKIQRDAQFQLPTEHFSTIDIMLALYAHEQEQQKVAAFHFKKAYMYISSTKDAWQLLLIAAETFLLAEETELMHTTLQSIATMCAGNDPCMARYWVALGMQQRLEGKFKIALATFQKQALPLAERLSDSSLSVNILMNIAELYEASESSEESVSAAEKARTLAWASNQIGSLRAYHKITGWLEKKKGAPKEAIYYYTKALDSWEPPDGLAKKGSILHQLANCYYAVGDIEDANQYYQESLSIWKKLGNIRQQAHLEFALGTMWLDKEDYSLAAHYFDSGATSYLIIKETQCAARLLSFLALCKLAQKLDNPEDLQLNEALKLVEPLIGTLGNEPIDGRALEALAMAYGGIGDYRRALEYIEKSIQLTDKINSISKQELLEHLFGRRASFALKLHYQSLAMESYQQVVKHALQASGGHLNASILLAMDAACDLAIQQGLPEVCENYWLDISNSPESNDAVSFLGQAQILTRLGHHVLARKIYTKILQSTTAQKSEGSKRAAIFSSSSLARLDNWDDFRHCIGIVVLNRKDMTGTGQIQSPIKDGDIIIKNAGQCASSFSVLRDFLSNPFFRMGQKSLPVQIWRNGQIVNIDISDNNLSLTVW